MTLTDVSIFLLNNFQIDSHVTATCQHIFRKTTLDDFSFKAGKVSKRKEFN